MGKHQTYRGVQIDMEALGRENENTVAAGNTSMNARGDILGQGGTITKTADEIAREHHRVRSAIKHTGLKGPSQEVPAIEDKKRKDILASASATGPSMPPRKVVETETENKDIIVNKGE